MFVSGDIPPPRKPPKVRSSVLPTSNSKKSARGKEQADDDPSPKYDHSYSYICYCAPDCACQGCAIKDQRMKDLLLKFEDLQVNSSAKLDSVVSCEEGSVCDKYLKTDEKVNTYTGLPSVKALEDLLELVTPHALSMTYWRGSQKYVERKEPLSAKSGPGRKLTIKEELVMTLMKLRLGLKRTHWRYVSRVIIHSLPHFQHLHTHVVFSPQVSDLLASQREDPRSSSKELV